MDIDDFNEDFISSTIHSELLSSHQSFKMLIYGIYALINQFELHLDRITNKYKYMTLTWLLATFAGIGFFFSTKTADLAINKHFISCIIGFFGIIGVLTIWYLDICIYQRFWGAFYISEINLEKRYKFLGKLTHTTMFLDTIKARISGSGRFYMISITLLILTIAINAFFVTPQLYLKIALVTIILLLGVFVVQMMISTGKKLQCSLQTLLK